MGCCSSSPATATPPSPIKPTKQPTPELVKHTTAIAGHGFNVAHEPTLRNDMPDFKAQEISWENELQDPVSSWEVTGIPEGYPRGKLLPPDRKLHEKHMKKLRKFMRRVDQVPSDLAAG